MAKAFARALYHSKKWEKVRTAALIRDHGLCQNPGCFNPAEEVHHIIELTPENVNDPSVALNLDNLMSVCRDCHFKIHREKILEKFKRSRKRTILDRNGCYFDQDGTLMQMQVYIVHGAPGSGKNEYVREHREETDMIVDLDAIQLALGQGRDSETNNLVSISMYIRDRLYDLIESRDKLIDCKRCWVIATLPEKKAREELAQRLRAELVHIDTEQTECIERAMSDGKRKNKQLERAIIEDYFERLER